MTIYKGWKAKLYKGSTEIGYVTNVKVDIDQGLEPYFEAGARLATKIFEGPLSVTGSFKRGWIDKAYATLVCNSASTIDVFDLKVNVASSAMVLNLYNCKLKKGSFDIPQDGFLVEDYDFIAQQVAVT